MFNSMQHIIVFTVEFVYRCDDGLKMDYFFKHTTPAIRARGISQHHQGRDLVFLP